MNIFRFVQFITIFLLVFPVLNIFPSSKGSGPLPGSYVEEDIVTNTIWDPSGSPYIVNGTIRVFPGVELEITSGVEVDFGQSGELFVEGDLYVGSDNGSVILTSTGPPSNGVWKGIRVNSGMVVLERTSVIGAKETINSTSSEVYVRNSTFSHANFTAVLDEGSSLSLSNTTFDDTTFMIKDNLSEIETFAYTSLIVVDKEGIPKGDVEVAIRDGTGMDQMVHFVNSTGEVPSTLLRGSTYNYSGKDQSTGQYSIVMRDLPFTHFNNRSIFVEGRYRFNTTVQFSWPPEMTNIPGSFFAYEDQYMVLQSDLLDRNNAGSVAINISSQNVWYDDVHGELIFVYEDQDIETERVFINLSDGYDNRSYSVNVTVVFRDDPPKFLLPYTLLYVVEGVPLDLLVDIKDEDTPYENLIVSTTDPQNVTFNRGNMSFIFLYGDGTPPEISVNLTVSDGKTNITKNVDVFFEPVFYPPYFTGPLPEVVIDEDTFKILDISPYFDDPDQDDPVSVSIEVKQAEEQIFAVSQNGTILNISSLLDANGSGSITVTLRDSRNNTISGTIQVTVLPLNDPPTLTAPNHTLIDDELFMFEVLYTDIDGDLPSEIILVLDGIIYYLSPMVSAPHDPVLGILYFVEVRPGPGDHLYSFSCSDGNLGNLTDIFDFYIPDIEKEKIIEGYDGNLQVKITYRRSVDLSLLTNTYAGDPSGQYEVKLLSFRLTGSIENISYLLVSVNLSLFNSDVLGSSSRVLSHWNGNLSQVLGINYSSQSGILNFPLGTTEVLKDIIIVSLLDPELDSDSDGYTNIVDVFPSDPLEWMDTDGDGIGNNEDLDDDGDGFPDELEIEAGTDPLSRTSIPLDTDGDQVFDHLDDDDDGDGIPDDWEINYGFDPKDPSDAEEDPDGDGRSNLKEYQMGSDPLVDNRKDDSGINLPWWLVLLILVLVLLLGLMGILFVVMGYRTKGGKEEEEEWSIREELDEDDAVECPECSSVYPFTRDECPFCGEENPYNEEME